MQEMARFYPDIRATLALTTIVLSSFISRLQCWRASSLTIIGAALLPRVIFLGFVIWALTAVGSETRILLESLAPTLAAS